MGFFDFMYPGGKAPQLTTAQAYAAQQSGARVIDIREITEWNRGHASDAEHIPQAKLLRPGTDLPTDEQVILMCSDGLTSMKAAQRLTEAGYQATSVHGGFDSWKRSGLPTEKS